MNGVTKAAKIADGRSRMCARCPIHKRGEICSPEVLRICYEAFVEGFKKGAKWSQEQTTNK